MSKVRGEIKVVVSKSEICMMKILIVAATQQEIQPFIKLNNHIEKLICGVGIPNTIYHLTKKLSAEKYDAVIQAGIAGSFSKKVKNGDVVAISKDTFGDIGAQENKKFKTLFQLGFEDENRFPFTKGWLINTSRLLLGSPLKKVKAVTINKINDQKKQAKDFKHIFDPKIESMEGAAFHFVCMQQNINYLQIRSISNKVGERDKKKWEIELAINNLNNELIKLINTINK